MDPVIIPIEEARRRREAHIVIIERRMEDRPNLKDLSDRTVIAANLGHILSPLRGQRGAIARLLQECGLAQPGDSTKRLARYVIWPDQGGVPDGKTLAPKVRQYRELALAAARSINPARARAVLIDLVAGSSLAADERADDPLQAGVPGLMESMVPLLDMLDAVARAADRRTGLGGAFRTIARWNLRSGNAGFTFESEDHPAGAEPDEPEYWADRFDLLPMARLCNLESGGDAVARGVWTTIDTERAIAVEIVPMRGLWLGLRPAGPTLAPRPMFVEQTVLEVVPHPWGEFSDQIGRRNRFDDPAFLPSPWLTPPNPGRGDGVRMALLREEFEGWLDGHLLLTEVHDGSFGGIASAVPIVEPLSLRSLHDALEGRRSQDERFAVRESASSLFQLPAFAHARSAAAAVERIVRYAGNDAVENQPGSGVPKADECTQQSIDRNDGRRLDSRLTGAAARIAKAVRQCDQELRDLLDRGSRAFQARQFQDH